MIKNKVFIFWDTSFENLSFKLTDFFNRYPYNPISSSFQRYGYDKYYASVTAKPIGEPEEPEEAEETEEEKTAERMFLECGFFKERPKTPDDLASFQDIIRKTSFDFGPKGTLTYTEDSQRVCLLPREIRACAKFLDEMEAAANGKA